MSGDGLEVGSGEGTEFVPTPKYGPRPGAARDTAGYTGLDRTSEEMRIELERERTRQHIEAQRLQQTKLAAEASVLNGIEVGSPAKVTGGVQVTGWPPTVNDHRPVPLATLRQARDALKAVFDDHSLRVSVKTGGAVVEALKGLNQLLGGETK